MRDIYKVISVTFEETRSEVEEISRLSHAKSPLPFFVCRDPQPKKKPKKAPPPAELLLLSSYVCTYMYLPALYS